MKEFEENEVIDFDDEMMDVVMNAEEKEAPKVTSSATTTPVKTAVEALGRICQTVLDNGLKEEVLETVKCECDYLNDLYGLTPFQCVMVAYMMNETGAMTLSRMVYPMSCLLLTLLNHVLEADELVNRGMAVKTYCDCSANHQYSLVNGFCNAVLENRSFVPKELSKLNKGEFIARVHQLIQDYEHHDDDAARQSIVDRLRGLYAGCSQLSMCATIAGLNLDDNDLLMISIAAVAYVKDSRTFINFSFYYKVWSDWLDNPEVYALLHGTSPLVRQGYLVCVEDFEDEGEIQLTDKAQKELFRQYEKSTAQPVAGHEDSEVNIDHPIIQSQSIGAKPLFYNPAESEQVQRLSDLLDQEHFKGVQQRLKESGLRQGFACLFYGDPGTGKTETVLQLARQTGRDIMRVDMSKVRDKYNGESEKAVQAIFDQYQELAKHRSVTPILLLNEADALLGQRIENARDWSDKMENALQNIVLQAMETFEGILIATTNLSGLLDSAFERRFLYKIKFTKPSLEVKEKIWHAMLPDLGADETHELAKSYDFSGGQIENVKRRQVVDYLLYGKTTGYDHIVQLCKEEKLVKNNSLAIGFK